MLVTMDQHYVFMSQKMEKEKAWECVIEGEMPSEALVHYMANLKWWSSTTMFEAEDEHKALILRRALVIHSRVKNMSIVIAYFTLVAEQR